MSYKNGIFVGKNPSRMRQRTQKFSDFFNDLGLTPTSDPFLYDPDPVAQMEKLSALLQQAQDLHGTETSAIEMMQSQLSSLSLGLPQIGTSKIGRPNINSHSTTGLTLSFFIQDIG